MFKRNSSKWGTIFLAVLLLILPVMAACSDNDETPTAQPADNQTASQPAWLTDPNEPPQNPYLADSVWSTTHRNSYCQGSSPYAGPSEAPVGEIEDYLPGRPVCPTVLFSSPYPDGSQVIWGASTRFHVYKADPNGQQLQYIDYLPTAELQDDPMTDEMVDQFGDMTSPELADVINSAFPTEESESGSQPGMSGVYYLLDKDGIFYQPRGTVIYAYGDKVKGDRFSPIELKRTYEIPVDKLIRDDDFIYGVVMTYDGMLMFYTVFGTIGIIDRSFDPNTVKYVQLPEGEYIGNQPACDENGGIYIVTQKQMHRVQWTGTELTTDESKGAWSAEYEGGVAKGRKFQEGSGASPSLMGVGDQDKFVVITDGAQIMNLVLFWRDEIPNAWEQIPGTKSRRIAAQVPVTYGNPDLDFTWSEQSVLVRGYGAFVPNDVLKIYHSNTAVNVLMSGEPDRAPYGCERFEWDPQTRQVKTVWASPDISIPNCIPTMSSATNLIYVTGQRDGLWTLEAIDWDTGKVAWNYEIGNKSRHNTAFAAVQVGPDGSIYFPTFFGIMRIRPTSEALPCEATTDDTKETDSAVAGPGWAYDVTYGDEKTVWISVLSGEENVGGIDTYVIETTYDSTPARKSYAEQVGKYVDLELNSEIVWQSKNDLDPVKMESMTKAMAAFDVTATSTYAYDGAHGSPLAEGNSWSYDQSVTPSMGSPYTTTWSVEVMGTEEVTVPAGTYECHKLVRSIEGGSMTEWWATDGSTIAPVKIVDEVTYEFPETRELATYTIDSE